MSMQFFASEMQADNNVLGKSNEAASAQTLSCDFMTVKNLNSSTTWKKFQVVPHLEKIIFHST